MAQRTYNVTSALAPGQLEKYSCLTTEKWLSNFGIPECLKECTRKANAQDGCAYDDFACHNINYQTYSDIIEPCVFPPELGGKGNCTPAALKAVRPIVNDAGNFYNATLYASYAHKNCKVRLSILKTLKIVLDEVTVVSKK
ncbi:hypothetical protein BU23DRAFT_478936 [Bimuria novae-zelandiae CBS 107.79]|uniref:CFEM domain-containing protein n=1 Tax=Bimuria novae-zelandiae CBS 107.79 TaxID=1447943 RepID=A0A6A5V6D6_9PLEO|nr:hypothetical protein BU23DRAFT_478936 [Bimuria novae-zelandiae CBS 107.79]